ncbi:MAG: hypothetical protein F6J92_02975 [Symploca sp. SIO1A3]|nr:hypothetical protein [Symploca sp. SIO1A3]
MAKKSLTDLLREEVDKSPQLAADTVPETNNDQLLDQDTEAVEKIPMSTTKSISNLTKAQLQATVTELRGALKKAQEALEQAQNQQESFANLQEALQNSQKNEASLKEEVTELKADLERQAKSVQKLEDVCYCFRSGTNFESLSIPLQNGFCFFLHLLPTRGFGLCYLRLTRNFDLLRDSVGFTLLCHVVFPDG